MIALFAVALLAASIQSASAAHNADWPIIGLFAQPSSSKNSACGGSCQYIAASYVKNLEAAGARVVPIDYYSTHEELDHLFASLNGFFFPGGGAAFPSSAQYIFGKKLSPRFLNYLGVIRIFRNRSDEEGE